MVWTTREDENESDYGVISIIEPMGVDTGDKEESRMTPCFPVFEVEKLVLSVAETGKSAVWRVWEIGSWT